MGVYINMEMPKTGLYFVSVDNSNGRDKTVITVERMLGNRDVRQIVGSFELVSVPEPHGRLGDLDDIIKRAKKWIDHPDEYISQRNKDMIYILEREDAIIPASLDGEPNKEC